MKLFLIGFLWLEKIVQFFLVSLSQSISENLKSYQFKIVKTISKEIPFFIILESRDIREDSNKQFTGYLSVSVQCSECDSDSTF